VDVVTVNVALLLPAATVTVAGTVAAGSLLPSVITAPPAGAGPFRVTVPVELPPPVTLAGFKLKELRDAGNTVNIEVCVAVP
jgi:hypothetical protein